MPAAAAVQAHSSAPLSLNKVRDRRPQGLCLLRNDAALQDPSSHPNQRQEQTLPPGRRAARPEQMDTKATRRKEDPMLQNAPMYAYIPASDLERARKFYEEKVGLVPKEEINGGVVYEFAGGTACFLYPTPNAGTSRASQAFWDVSDVDKEISELKSRGVVFEDYDMPGERSPAGAVLAGGAKAAWFKDSEGNIMALVQSL
jgi:predicted enzyme related to lactoylglutathione lyase